MPEKNSSQNGIAQMIAGAVIASAVIAGCWYFFKDDDNDYKQPQTIYVETSHNRAWDFITPKK